MSFSYVLISGKTNETEGCSDDELLRNVKKCNPDYIFNTFIQHVALI